MARKREGAVLEPLEEITALAELYAGSGAEERLRMLEMLARETPATLKSVAEILGRPERTIRRWWKTYEHEGLTRLIGEQPRAGGVGPYRVTGEHDTATGSKIPAHVARFLNGLPTSCDVVDWLTALRKGLLKLLPDVDVAMVALDVHCDIVERSGGRPAIAITHAVSSEPGHGGQASVSSSVSVRGPSDQIIEAMVRDGFAPEEFHAPVSFDYYLDGRAYVGTVVLLCRRSRPILSRSSIETMRALEPFMAFLLSDGIARQRLRQPEQAPFRQVVDAIGDRIGLTVRQKQVVLLQLLGFSYAQIAQRMGISETTVSHHVQSIHEKAGTHSYTELFARFFTPLRDD